MRLLTPLAALPFLSLMLAVCGSTSSGTSGPEANAAVEALPAAPSGRVSSAPLSAAPGAPGGQSAPPVDMAGRWTLASSGGGACGMRFGGSSGGAEGTIAPEGGCPGSFFTSRKWTYEPGGLVIRDHTGKPLAQLAAAGPGRFEGRGSEGAGITLSR